MHELSCVIHLHSTYSDGTATVPELLEEARKADVDALLLTDHDTLAARRDGWEGNHEGVFLFVGIEVSPKQGHYLAFGVTEEIAHRGLSAGEITAAVRAGAPPVVPLEPRTRHRADRAGGTDAAPERGRLALREIGETAVILA